MAKITTTITPGIDSVIAARIDAMTKAEWARKTGVEKLPFITISREYGTEAPVVAKRMVDMLNEKHPSRFPWMAFDKEILSRISEESGHYPGMVQLITDEKLSILGQVVIDLLSQLPDSYQIYRKMAKAICILAEKGHAVLVGRGSAVLTRQIDRGLHIRLVAPRDYRIERVMKLYNLDHGDAEKEVRKMDEEREQFVKRFAMASPSDPYLYHFTFNTAMCTTEEIARTAVEFLRHRKWL
ncbi:MAG: cytidylate kinase-like family protein [Acidobacteriota bacterium]